MNYQTLEILKLDIDKFISIYPMIILFKPAFRSLFLLPSPIFVSALAVYIKSVFNFYPDLKFRTEHWKHVVIIVGHNVPRIFQFAAVAQQQS